MQKFEQPANGSFPFAGCISYSTGSLMPPEVANLLADTLSDDVNTGEGNVFAPET